jgi:hypothetical protein
VKEVGSFNEQSTFMEFFETCDGATNEDYVSSILQMSSGISIGFFNFVQHLNHINIICCPSQSSSRHLLKTCCSQERNTIIRYLRALDPFHQGLLFLNASLPRKNSTGVWYSKSIRGPYPAHYCYKTVAR